MPFPGLFLLSLLFIIVMGEGRGTLIWEGRLFDIAAYAVSAYLGEWGYYIRALALIRGNTVRYVREQFTSTFVRVTTRVTLHETKEQLIALPSGEEQTQIHSFVKHLRSRVLQRSTLLRTARLKHKRPQLECVACPSLFSFYFPCVLQGVQKYAWSGENMFMKEELR